MPKSKQLPDQPDSVESDGIQIHQAFRGVNVHVLRKLRDFLWRRQPAVAGESVRRRRQILPVAGVATADADEISALCFQERQCRLDGCKEPVLKLAALQLQPQQHQHDQPFHWRFQR